MSANNTDIPQELAPELARRAIQFIAENNTVGLSQLDSEFDCLYDEVTLSGDAPKIDEFIDIILIIVNSPEAKRVDSSNVATRDKISDWRTLAKMASKRRKFPDPMMQARSFVEGLPQARQILRRLFFRRGSGMPQEELISQAGVPSEEAANLIRNCKRHDLVESFGEGKEAVVRLGLRGQLIQDELMLHHSLPAPVLSMPENNGVQLKPHILEEQRAAFVFYYNGQ